MQSRHTRRSGTSGPFFIQTAVVIGALWKALEFEHTFEYLRQLLEACSDWSGIRQLEHLNWPVLVGLLGAAWTVRSYMARHKTRGRRAPRKRDPLATLLRLTKELSAHVNGDVSVYYEHTTKNGKVAAAVHVKRPTDNGVIRWF